MSGYKEEKLFSIWSNGWDREMPVLLITYDGGSMDLHCQTGDHHDKALLRAKKELSKRNLKISGEEMIGGSGVYYGVEKCIPNLEVEKKNRYEVIANDER